MGFCIYGLALSAFIIFLGVSDVLANEAMRLPAIVIGVVLLIINAVMLIRSKKGGKG